MTATTPTETAAVRNAGRLRGLQSGAREIDDAEVEVRGTLPDWLRGSLLLNGPALWDLPNGGYGHWFDGQAMFHRIRLGQGAARYRSRFQQSEDYKATIALGRPAFGGFAQPIPENFWQRLSHFGKPKATDNGAVVMARIGDQWVAQTETPLLTRFDPETLETQGRFEYDDHEEMNLCSAHSLTDDQGVYWNVGVALGPQCTYKLFRIRPGSRKREIVAQWKVPRSGYLHGFAMTPTHAVVWEPALRAQPLKFIFTGNAYIDNFGWQPEAGSRIHVVSLADGSVRSWKVPPFMAFHAIQAFDEDGAVVLDLCTTKPEIVKALTMDRLRSGQSIGVEHQALRFRLWGAGGEAAPQMLGGGFDLPMVHGGFWMKRRARWAFGAGFDPSGQAPMFDRTVKVDLDGEKPVADWQRPDAVHMEPLFVEKPGSSQEEEGVLLVPTLAEGDDATMVGVVDPGSMEALATLHLPQVVPFGFHAAWARA